MTWDFLENIYQDTPAYLVSRLRMLKLTKAIRGETRQKRGMTM